MRIKTKASVSVNGDHDSDHDIMITWKDLAFFGFMASFFGWAFALGFRLFGP